MVTVQLVLKSTYSKDGKTSPPAESKYDLTGTVVNASGLIALAHSCCDPAEFYKRASSAYEGYKVESEITDLKILLDDNTEVPAEIVLRDRDHDLAFARPKGPPPHAWEMVDLTKPVTAKVFDPIVALNRLNSISGRSYSASLGRIMAVVDRPQRFYLYDGASPGFNLGSPIFTLNGEFLGLALMHVSGSRTSNDDDNAVSIILPAEQILKAARQVPPRPEKAESAEANKQHQ